MFFFNIGGEIIKNNNNHHIPPYISNITLLIVSTITATKILIFSDHLHVPSLRKERWCLNGKAVNHSHSNTGILLVN